MSSRDKKILNFEMSNSIFTLLSCSQFETQETKLRHFDAPSHISTQRCELPLPRSKQVHQQAVQNDMPETLTNQTKISEADHPPNPTVHSSNRTIHSSNPTVHSSNPTVANVAEEALKHLHQSMASLKTDKSARQPKKGRKHDLDKEDPHESLLVQQYQQQQQQQQQQTKSAPNFGEMEKIRTYLRDMLRMSEEITPAFDQASDESVEETPREEEEEEGLGDSISEMMQDSPTISNAMEGSVDFPLRLERNDSISDLLLTSTQHASR